MAVTSRICTNCSVEKPFSEFHKCPNAPYGINTRCKDCRNAINRQRYADANDTLRASHLSRQRKHRYGLTTPDYEFFVSSRGSCEICGNTENLCVDHDHVTNELRGVLCRNCNMAIGLLSDNVTIVERAAAYLRKGY